MSLSTTTTISYDLLKYSRAYSDLTSATEQGELNGNIRQSGHSPSARYRIPTATEHLENCFRMSFTHIVTQPLSLILWDERIQEDLDLIAYSSVPSLQNRETAMIQGLPLKAVYQDAVVGIRYLYPRVPPSGATPDNRIFGAFKLLSNLLLLLLLLSTPIRFICPCKANSAPPARNMRPPAAKNIPSNAAHMRPTLTQFNVNDSMRPDANNSLRRSDTTFRSSEFRDSAYNLSVTDAEEITHTSVATPGQTVIPAYSPAFLPASSDDNHPTSRPSSTVTETSTRAEHSSVGAASTVSQTMALNQPHTRRPLSSNQNSSDSSLPSSSLFDRATRAQESAGTQSALPVAGAVYETSSPLLDSLRETSSLYHLPRHELENLVASVIREEGFVDFLRILDSMWAIKGSLGLS
ncbi:hypothetical protein A0H81_09042 [Grifola frondosa]|uniref:Uncharacterized protein n=1 Tax=Grifola frondosa TaxID=5627 RepID=A0A1C7M1D7_GRIFR|nr:hypothetical protein A0H81_09042 [Grifola frondosa]